MRRLAVAIAAMLFLSIFLAVAHPQGACYTIIVTVKDGDGTPIVDASVRVTTKYGPDDYRDAALSPYRTNASGVVVYENVYSVDGLASIIVSKNGVELASGSYQLTSTRTTITVVCRNMATLTVYAKDSSGQPLKNAFVKLLWQSFDGLTWEASQTSDEQGKAVFRQMSYWTYQVQVSWQGLTVHQGVFSFSSSARSYNAMCKVHNLTVNVFDAANKPLTNAKVVVSGSGGWRDTKYTSKGSVVFPQLPEANYTVQVQYEIYTNTTAVKLSSTKTVNIKLNFIVMSTCNVVLKALWSDNKPIADAGVKVTNSEGYTVFTGFTNATGHCPLQLLEGTYTFTVSKGSATQTKTVTVTSQTTVTLTIDTSYRISTVKVEVYKDGALANGVLIKIYRDGRLIDSVSAPNGEYTFNLPDGVYTFIVRLQDQELEKAVIINQDTAIPIYFGAVINPMVIYAPLLLAVLAVVVVASVKLKRKAERKPVRVILQ
ncbi:MAG: carboxypeptidase-like regulatory domain-containing protein [Candidatus Bathyarchaeia archaeon]